EQAYELRGETYRNLICAFGPEDAPRVVIGAHYDVHFNNNPGADDNASGIAAIVELARLIKEHEPVLSHRIELVAFTLEEQPHFQTSDMGSYQYAEKLFRKNVPVKLMISVEMIGYFSDIPASQSYPTSFLKLLYPGRGNFIGVVGQALDRTIVKRAKRLLTVSPDLPVYSINAPAFIPGIDRSDHRNFWRFNFPAVMITDTANFRNPNYHTANDRPETLDYEKMKFVVEGLYRIATDY
ncbi:MAG: M28 family peptidase, partial [Methyloligellaceae bacterium]